MPRPSTERARGPQKWAVLFEGTQTPLELVTLTVSPRDVCGVLAQAHHIQVLWSDSSASRNQLSCSDGRKRDHKMDGRLGLRRRDLCDNPRRKAHQTSKMRLGLNSGFPSRPTYPKGLHRTRVVPIF